MIEEDHWDNIGQLCAERFVKRMVKAGTTIEEHERRFLPHRGTIGYEARTLHVKEESYSIDEHVHRLSSLMRYSIISWLPNARPEPPCPGRHPQAIPLSLTRSAPGRGAVAAPRPWWGPGLWPTTTVPPWRHVCDEGAGAPRLRTDGAGGDAGGGGSRVGALAGARHLGLLAPHRAHRTPAVSRRPHPPTSAGHTPSAGGGRLQCLMRLGPWQGYCPRVVFPLLI